MLYYLFYQLLYERYRTQYPILRALNVSSRLQAAIVARRLDLIDEPAFAGRAEREPFSRAMQPVAMHVAWNGNNSSLPVAADRSLAEAVA